MNAYDYLKSRINSALEWYVGCDVCDETLQNVGHDLNSVLEETMTKYRIKQVPFFLRAKFDGPDIVVLTIDRNLQ